MLTSKQGKYSLSEKLDAELPSKITVSITQFSSDTSYTFEAVNGVNAKQFEAVNSINTSYTFEAVNGVNAKQFEAVNGINTSYMFEAVNGVNVDASQPTVAKTSERDKISEGA